MAHIGIVVHAASHYHHKGEKQMNEDERKTSTNLLAHEIKEAVYARYNRKDPCEECADWDKCHGMVVESPPHYITGICQTKRTHFADESILRVTNWILSCVLAGKVLSEYLSHADPERQGWVLTSSHTPLPSSYKAR